MSTDFDLQPDPRILPMLGEINLAPWRCLAVDNSIDSFIASGRESTPIEFIAVPAPRTL